MHSIHEFGLNFPANVGEPRPPAFPATPEPPCLSRCLIELASALRRLSLQAHLVHLNYEATNFLSVHSYFGQQYLAHLEQFDKIAEHVRAADMLMPLRTDELDCSCIAFSEPDSYRPDSLLVAYVQSAEAVAEYVRNLSAAAEDERAIDVVDTLGALYGDLKKASWFVKSLVR